MENEIIEAAKAEYMTKYKDASRRELVMRIFDADTEIDRLRRRNNELFCQLSRANGDDLPYNFLTDD